MTLITTPFGFGSTAAEVVAGIDLSGKRAIVTGGASGIGIETARALAARRRRGDPRRTQHRRTVAQVAADIAGAPYYVAPLDLCRPRIGPRLRAGLEPVRWTC